MTTCPVCGGSEYVPWHTAANRHGRQLLQPSATFPMQVCTGCGLLAPAGIAVDETYFRTFYPQGYHPDGTSQSIPNRLWALIARNALRRRARLLARLARPEAGRIRLLDVGCGHGQFLRTLDLAAFDPHGLEMIAEAVADARRHGLDVNQGDVLEAPLGNGRYDVVTLWHVVEHIEHPSAALRRIHAALSPNGIVAMATPNTDSWACARGRDRWFHLDVPRHLHLFNVRNMDLMLGQAGFEVVYRAFLPFDYPLDLLWSVLRDWRSLPLLAIYPIAKLFDHQNQFVVARKITPDDRATSRRATR